MLSKIEKRLYDREQFEKSNMTFSNKALLQLLIPIIVELLLNSFMGMADTMMVSNVGSEAISAVSLVDSINLLVIQVFSALAAGAGIICSQYIGSNDKKASNEVARQVVFTVVAISVGITILCLLFAKPLLRLTFGSIDQGVMEKAVIYFIITVISYPFIALFNAGSALYRASGNSRFPMRVSAISNILNIGGNAILIFGLQLGVEGAALATLLSRVFCTVVIFYYLRKPQQDIVINHYMRIKPNKNLIIKILAIGIPTGIENGMFQFGKLAIQSTVSTMGTTAIAAQAMTNIMENVNGIASMGIGIGLMTVVGQCIGAGKVEEAKYYIVKLTALAELAMITTCLFAYAITPWVTRLAKMESASAALCLEMMLAITIVKPIAWTLSFVPVYGMRAAGDVKFSMIISTITMWFCRVALCVFLVKVFHFGPIAVWIGMFADWTIRSFIFTGRFLSQKWLGNNVI